MGDPNSGEIYAGQLRPGDIELTKGEADRFKEVTLQDRMAEFQRRFREQDAAQAAASSGVTREMPRYKCHKEVWALKIKEIKPILAKPTIAELEQLLDSGAESPVLTTQGEMIGGWIIVPADEGYAPFEADSAYMNKHKPEAGGYYVVYKDSYKSYSPAQAFSAHSFRPKTFSPSFTKRFPADCGNEAAMLL